MVEKYIITGGPGAGKTALLNELKKRGHIIVPEVARQIIAEEQAKEIANPNYKGIYPFTDLALFEDLVIERQLQYERKLPSSGKIFLDRALADPIAYAKVGNISLRNDLQRLIAQADYKRVFYLERLPFYHQDKERKESLELVERIHDGLYEIYDNLGFDIVRVPIYYPEKEANIEERIKLILRETNSEKNVEIERKYRVDHAVVKEVLQQYAVNYIGTDNEKNTLYDFYGILKEFGLVLRIRENNGKHILTMKGPSKSVAFTHKKEYNFSIPEVVSKSLQLVLPAAVSYSKRRENYRPLGDASCTISLDYLPRLGEFVEIEAGSENQVLLWERRLGISDYAIKGGYPQLVNAEKSITKK